MTSRVAAKVLHSKHITLPQLLLCQEFLSSSNSNCMHTSPIHDCYSFPRASNIAAQLFPPNIPSIAFFPSRSVHSLYSKFELGASVLSSFRGDSFTQCLWLQRSSHSSTKHTENINSSILCWSCGTKSNKGNLICPSCSALQTADPSIDYFQMFDVDKKYDLDLKDLEGRYKNLMRKLHPDLFHGKSTKEQVNSAELASIVTKAYDELFKPVSRATYLLKLQGIHMEEEGTVNDPELIMEVMELRENFEHSSDKKTLQQLCDTAKARMDEWTSSFTAALKEDNKTAAVAALQRMSYFNRLYEDIRWKLL